MRCYESNKKKNKKIKTKNPPKKSAEVGRLAQKIKKNKLRISVE